ncbi:MAG: RNA-binding domain-containing protein [Candidatus Bathycorpusculaceae bacterium]
MDEVKVYIEAEINPTESEEKVKRAVENIFGGIQTKTQLTHERGLLTAEVNGTEALTKLYNLLRRERIRDAARGALFEGLSGKSIGFCLNKQVAYVGHVSFSKEVAESPLGPIKVRIECEDPKKLIDWLAPKTV